MNVDIEPIAGEDLQKLSDMAKQLQSLQQQQANAQMGKDLKAAGITLCPVRRSWDEDFWPHATKGFFPFKEKIPALLQKRRML